MLNHFSHVGLFTTLRTVAHQAPLSLGLSRQEYWSGLPCPPSGELPNPGITEPLGSSYCHTLKFFLGSQQFAHLSPPLNYELFEGRVSILLLFDSVPSIRGFPGGALVKNLPADAGDTGLILVSGRSPLAVCSSILAWKIPWTEEPDRLWSMGSQRVRHKQATELTRMHPPSIRS